MNNIPQIVIFQFAQLVVSVDFVTEFSSVHRVSILRMLQKMEFSSLLLTVTFLLYGDYVKCQSQIVSFHVQPADGRNSIVEGDTVVFICQVNLDFNDATDTLFISKINSPGKLTQLATETDASDDTKSVEWSKNDVQSVLTVIIPDISRDDVGDYICFAVREDGNGGNIFLGQRNITVDVLYAASGSPVCETSPLNDGVIWYHGDEITLRCTSNTGNPIVTLTWSNDRTISIPNANTRLQLPDNLESNVTVTLDSMHDGVTFTCSRYHQSFPTNLELCYIGPLTVEEERPTTLAQTISSETSTIIPPTTGSLNTAINMKSKPSESTDGIGVIVAIVVVCIIVIGIAILIVIFLVRFGRCASILKSNNDDSRTENLSLEAGQNNGKIVVEDHSHDNPAVDANHVLSPNGGQLYAVVQKNTPARESCASDTSKVYPTAPEYQRPEKTRQSDGDLYANAGIVRDEASGESLDNPSINSAARKDTAGLSSEKSNDCAASGTNLYADPSEIASGEPADASLIGTTRKQDDSEMALYANPSEVIPDNSHMPAPSEAPPAPPVMAHTPGLDYADLDIARPASLGADGRVDIISNEDQVVYASVK